MVPPPPPSITDALPCGSRDPKPAAKPPRSESGLVISIRSSYVPPCTWIVWPWLAALTAAPIVLKPSPGPTHRTSPPHAATGPPPRLGV